MYLQTKVFVVSKPDILSHVQILLPKSYHFPTLPDREKDYLKVDKCQKITHIGQDVLILQKVLVLVQGSLNRTNIGGKGKGSYIKEVGNP